MSPEDRRTAATLGPNTMAHLGRQLRAMYDHIIAEGVPEQFAEIVRRLDEPSNEGSKKEPTTLTV
jgi:hypothetical protein